MQAAILAADMLDKRIETAGFGMTPNARTIVVSDGEQQQVFLLKRVMVKQWRLEDAS